eukprot:gnl/MRDRNA2_/MRDRNA2_91070_c0_seq1.p1 gnl/MRDRNA2_/MRDRNA2_91070_c0~~gnl/MRDRNA2_/MRDRNA2_91070_c0_seq1.p1  ORF type:complete len:275 (-),score=73.30 gnl/MRDRNA2_/MRDRNA2_91070_c0_seq1:87-911(-)
MGRKTGGGFGTRTGCKINVTKVSATQAELNRKAAYDLVKGLHRVHSTGEKLPPLYSIHRATVVNILSDVGAFVQLGDGKTYKDGLLHIAAINMHPVRHKGLERLENVNDVLGLGAKLWVKVNEVKPGEEKYGLDMRWVHQLDGTDLNPNNNNVKNRTPPDNGFFGQTYMGSTATLREKLKQKAEAPEEQPWLAANENSDEEREKERMKERSEDEEKIANAQAKANKLSRKAEKKLKKVIKLKKKAKKLKQKIKGKKGDVSSDVSSDLSSDSGSA